MKHARRTTGLYNTPMSLTTDIRSYQPFNQQEASDREVILRQLEADPRVFQRDSLAHMTCSIWTVDPTATKTLMVFHTRTGRGGWIAGTPTESATWNRWRCANWRRRPASPTARIVPCGPGNIFSLEVLTVDGHEKRGRYVSSHVHLNVTYLAVASPDDPLRVKPDENSGVRWMDLDEALAASTEPWMRDRIYASSSTSWPRSTSK